MSRVWQSQNGYMSEAGHAHEAGDLLVVDRLATEVHRDPGPIVPEAEPLVVCARPAPEAVDFGPQSVEFLAQPVGRPETGPGQGRQPRQQDDADQAPGPPPPPGLTRIRCRCFTGHPLTTFRPSLKTCALSARSGKRRLFSQRPWPRSQRPSGLDPTTSNHGPRRRTAGPRSRRVRVNGELRRVTPPRAQGFCLLLPAEPEPPMTVRSNDDERLARGPRQHDLLPLMLVRGPGAVREIVTRDHELAIGSGEGQSKI